MIHLLVDRRTGILLTAAAVVVILVVFSAGLLIGLRWNPALAATASPPTAASSIRPSGGGWVPFALPDEGLELPPAGSPDDSSDPAARDDTGSSGAVDPRDGGVEEEGVEEEGGSEGDDPQWRFEEVPDPRWAGLGPGGEHPEPRPAPADRVPTRWAAKSPEPSPPPQAASPPAPAARVQPARRSPAPRPSRPEPAAETRVAAAASGRDAYSVQVGAYRTPEYLRAALEGLRGRGYEPYVVELDTAAGRLATIRIGRYPDRAEAKKAARRLVAEAHMAALVRPLP